MTAEDFQHWLDDMKAAGLATSDAAAARSLGLSPNAVVKLKRTGLAGHDRRTALACRALLHRLEPYGEDASW